MGVSRWMERAGWEEWYEDDDGKYVKPLDGEGKVAYQYLFVYVTDMVAAVGEREYSEHGGELFLWEVSLVDVIAAGLDAVKSAADSWGAWDELSRLLDDKDLGKAFPMMADMLFDHGTKGLLESGGSSRFGWSRARGVRAAEQLIVGGWEELLDRPVNKIGSSARDFMEGDCLAGLRRYASDVVEGERAADCPASNIMMKMHNASGGMTLAGRTETGLAQLGNNAAFTGGRDGQ